MGEVLFPGVQIIPLSPSSHSEAKLISKLGPLNTGDLALSLKETTGQSSKCLGRVGTYTLNPTEGGLPPCHTLS